MAPAVYKICESFKHNLIKRAQGKRTFLSLILIHNKCKANAIKFDINFGGGKYGCAYVAMGKQQYALHSHITFVLPRKPGCSQAFPLNPMHINIFFTD